MNEDDWSKLHYAVGLLLGIAHRYGVVDVNIYHNSIHVRIEPIKEAEDEDRQDR